jgi:hypothetical protein
MTFLYQRLGALRDPDPPAGGQDDMGAFLTAFVREANLTAQKLQPCKYSFKINILTVKLVF